MTDRIEHTIRPLDWLLAREDEDARAHIVEAPARPGRTVWILSYTGVSDEPRVLRQAWSLVQAGWNVVIAGYAGRSPRPADWTFLQLKNRARSGHIAFRAALHLQRAVGRLFYIHARRCPLLAQAGARLHYFALPNWRQDHREVLRHAETFGHLRPDLVIAHDVFTAPPAARLAKLSGAALAIDCHEYGRGQYLENPSWSNDGRHFAIALQDDYLARADAVTTVSDGIRDLLNAEQTLKRPAVTVRSMPMANIQPFRPTGDAIVVLYHGLLCPGRGLEAAVESLRNWRPGFSLLLRGDGDAGWIAQLRAIAARNGVSDRLRIEPAVAFDDIVPAANAADIGYFAQPDLSPQKRFTLPNKFFEYVMAGLALCVADLPEMAALVRRHDLGRLVPGQAPQDIADAVNGFTREDIDRYKRASIAAAQELNWQAEQRIMLDLFDEITPGRRAPTYSVIASN
jgi:glycogen synthase